MACRVAAGALYHGSEDDDGWDRASGFVEGVRKIEDRNRNRDVRGKYMETPGKQNPAEAEAHIASAQQILKALQEKIGEHPEIGEAITKLEMALNVLAIKTGGLL
jgi:hypothetical protein